MKSSINKISCIILILFSYIVVHAQIPTAPGQWQWVKSIGSANQIGGSNYIDEKINQMATDRLGNVYVCGQVMGDELVKGLNGGSAYGQIISTHLSPNNLHAFVAKYDCNGTVVWYKTMGDSLGNTRFNNIVVDTFGNVYLSGFYNHGKLNEYFGDSIFVPQWNTSSGASNGLVMKLTPNGQLKWWWSYPKVMGNNTTLSFAPFSGYLQHYTDINVGCMLICHDTLVVLGSQDSLGSLSQTANFSALFDFNMNTGQLLQISKLAIGVNAASTQYVGFSNYGSGQFIAAVNFTSPTHQILDSVVNTPGVGRGCVFVFNRNHFIDKVLFQDTAGITFANFSKSNEKNFVLNAYGFTGHHIINGYYGQTIVTWPFQKISSGVFQFNGLHSLIWATTPRKTYDIAVIGNPTSMSSKDVIVPLGITDTIIIQNDTFIEPSPTTILEPILTLKYSNGKIKFRTPDMPLSGIHNNNSFDYALYSSVSTTINGNLILTGNNKNNNLLIPNKDTTQFFGGNNDLFTLKWGNDCAHDTAMIAPAPPEALVAKCLGASIQLNWQDISTLETGYKLYRSLSPTNGFTQLGATMPPNSTTYTDNGVVPYTTYYYRVVAFNNIDSSYSSSDSARLCTVGINTLEQNNFELHVWPNPTTNELYLDNTNSKITSFELVNLLGEVLIHQEQLSNAVISINTTKLNPGIYFIKAKDAKGNVNVARVVKEKGQ